MNYLIELFAFTVLLLFTNRLSYVNVNYKNVFAVEYQWADFWESNIQLFRNLFIILNACVAVFLWVIVHDSRIGITVSCFSIFVLFAYWFVCVTTGIHAAEEDTSWTNSYGQVFREHFWYWFWVYPNFALTELFIQQVAKNGQSTYHVTAISWLVFIGLFIHILINPFVD